MPRSPRVLKNGWRRPLAIVAAVGRNMAIGRANALPWTMPGDLAHFRVVTMGKPIIMGRRTFASIGRALPGRESIVVSRDASLDLPDLAWWAGDPAEALAMAQARAVKMGADEIALIGGATLFSAMMAQTTRLHMTFVDLAPKADVFFPAIDPAIWRETGRVVPPRHPRDEAACVFVDYERV